MAFQKDKTKQTHHLADDKCFLLEQDILNMPHNGAAPVQRQKPSECSNCCC